jgi:hypothetical protein
MIGVAQHELVSGPGGSSISSRRAIDSAWRSPVRCRFGLRNMGVAIPQD